MAKKSPKKVLKSRWDGYSQILIAGAIISVFFSALGYLGTDIWLASTQWMIVAAVLAGLGIYAKLESR